MKKLMFTLLIVVAAAGTIRAQEYEIDAPVEDEVVVGAIGGTVDLSALGGAVYSIPIQVPEGMGGIQPDISIVYNSQSGNGLLGWGWNLGGLSAITRVGHTLYHDGYVDGVDFDGDRFALDGQRLFALDGVAYGGNGTEYRTETDGMNKVVSYTETIQGGNGGLFGQGSYEYEIISHFKVFTVDGRVLYYGKVDNELDNARIIDESSGQKEVVLWLLKRVEDRMGNYMVYNYIIDSNGHNYRLDNIQYCANANVSDVGSMNRGTKYGLDFHYYSNRIDKECITIGNYILYQPWLLSDISIYHWSKPLSSYYFVYDGNSGQENSLYHYNRLKELQYRFENSEVTSTVIDWGSWPSEINNPNNFVSQDLYFTTVDFNDPQGLFFNNFKFSGDFNGDGFSDVIVVGASVPDNTDERSLTDSIYEKTVVREMRIYLNEGHNKLDASAGSSSFRKAEFTVSGQETNTLLLTDVDWIYVCDFNGDGLDDIVTFGQHYNLLHTQQTVTVEAFKSVILADGSWSLERVFFDGDSTNDYWSIHIGALQSATLLTGDFCGRNRDDLIVARNSGHSRKFYYLSYDENTNQIYSHESASDWKGITYATCDYDGDGKTEVWFADEGQPGKLVKLYLDQNGQYTYYQIRQCFDSNCRLFVGDFNGDGNSDFLVFHAERQVEGWEIVLGGAETSDFSFDVSYQMLEYAGGDDPGDYHYNFGTRESGVSIKFFLGVFDVDGDGKSDIVVRKNNNSSTALMFGPLKRDLVGASFALVKTYTNESILFSAEQAYGICVGNFLGQENLAILHNKSLFSPPQHSIYYNVKSITDGMGNRISFDYDYLVHNPMKSDNIYEVDCIGEDLDYGLYHIPLPLKAVRTLSSFNINLPTQAHAVDSFSYANTIAHRKGKGILGFESVTRDSWQVDYPTKNNRWTKHQSKWVRTFNFKPMGQHRSLVLDSEVLYRYNNDGEEVKTLSTNYRYKKGLCERDINSLGIKVFVPLTVGVITDEYELLGERGHLRRRITENEYDGQLQADGTIKYHDIVRATDTRQGTDSGQPAVAANCEFQTITHTEYASILNSGNLWVPNRPNSVFVESTRATTGYTDSKSLRVYSYDNDQPYLPKFVTNYPSGVESGNDLFAMTAYYTYYPTGRLEAESHYPFVGRSEDGFRTMYAYSPDHRFLTKKTEEYDPTHTNDYETFFESDNIYGDLRTEIDCNGYSTYTENFDHLGLTIRSYRLNNDENRSQIPGTETVTAIRWLAGSDYECHQEGLTTPSYFSWKRSSGSAEKITIYDAMGRELRTVSHGLPENGVDKIIYQDTQYDEWGRLNKISEPYYRGMPLAQRKWTTYTYGDFDRVSAVFNPQYTTDNQTIEPYTRYDYDGLVTKVTSGVVGNAQTHVTQTTLNVMGWTESNAETIDENGTENVTTYGYNANGSLAWAKVNGDETTKVSLVYDNAGNRMELYDPDYGHVTSRYNAFGQLVRMVSPKGDVTQYEYDNLGRIKRCIETDNNNANQPDRITVWNYSEATGGKGLLLSITLREGNAEKQTIAYNYDGQHYNRLSSTTETLFGTPYSTAYSYDGQNGFPLRIKGVTYPSGYTIENGYDALTGNLTEIRHNNQLLWKTHEANALGQITHYEMGNGVHSYYQYDDRHLLSTQQASKNGNTIQNFGYSYDVFGNLAARTEDKFSMPHTETFTYDYLNRLKTITLNETVNSEMTYDAFGRILSKEMDGQTVFGGAQYNTYDQHGNLKPHAISSATMTSNSFVFPLLDITYTMFDKVKSIGQYDENENLLSQIGYQYGYDHERILMDYNDNYEKLYVGNCEAITQNGSTQWNTFISGPMGVFAAVTSNGTTESLRYVYKDHLGSWTTLTDDAGTILQEMSYDAWGNIRVPWTWTSGSYSGLQLYDRGFTGHEHLGFGLINMNGRIYDPVMSSFLSVDNYIQSPDFSQSFNRYAYCLNNPLIYIDPTGEKWWHWAIADVLSGGLLSSSALLTAGATLTTMTTTGLTAYITPLPYSEIEYVKQKYNSPIAFQLDVRCGTHQRGVGFNISIGLPKSLPYAKRWEWGSSYYWKNYGNYRGYEHRKGSEQSVLGLYHWGKTHYESGEFTQTVGNKNFGMPSIAGIDISNDLWGDQGDRYRTSYQRINFGPIRVENAIFTGDPGPSGKRFNYVDETLGPYGTYIGSENPYYNPDQYRHGILSFGIGPLNFGADTEGIRNFFQNGVHDMKSVQSPHFRDLRGTPEYEAMGGDKFYFQFGYYRIW